MFERFTEKAIKVIMLAQEEARRLGHNFVGTEQVLLGLIGEGTGIAAKSLKSFGVNLRAARIEVEKIIGRGSGFVSVEIPFTPRAKRLIELAWDEARQLGHDYIGTEHLLLGLIQEGAGVAVRTLEILGVHLTKTREHVIRLLGETAAASETSVFSSAPQKLLAGLAWIHQFGTDLTALAKSGMQDPIYGRGAEIDQVLNILSQRTNANALLTGESGVGKSAIVGGVAARIATFDVPNCLIDAKIVILDFQQIMVHRETNKIIKETLEAAKENRIILVIDDLDALMQFRGSPVALNVLNWYLKHSTTSCVAIADLNNIRSHIGEREAILQYFQPVIVHACSPDEAIKMLQSSRTQLERHHELSITDEAISLAVSLSERGIKDRLLPGGAMTVLDEACALVRLRIDKQCAIDRVIGEIRNDIDECVAENDRGKAESLRELEAELVKRSQNNPTSKEATVTASDVEEAICAWTN